MQNSWKSVNFVKSHTKLMECSFNSLEKSWNFKIFIFLFQESALKSFNIIRCIIDKWIYHQGLAWSGLLLSKDFSIFLILSGLEKSLKIIMINEVFLAKIGIKSGLFYWSPISFAAWLSPRRNIKRPGKLFCILFLTNKLGTITGKWLNNQGDQILVKTAIFQ